MSRPGSATDAEGTGVAVVGSANLDVVVQVSRFPSEGETVLGERLDEVAGGKGLNQALAANRTARCAFIGCTGDDVAGRTLVEVMRGAGVDTRHVRRSTEPTGHAFIQVRQDGANTIVVLPSANSTLAPRSVVESLERSAPAVVLTQLEVPIECVVAAARWADQNAARFMMNASPFRELPPSLLAVCDPLTVNRSEAAALVVGLDGDALLADATAGVLADRLASRVRSVAVTDGRHGVHVGNASEGIHFIPALEVSAVDTTGAGDEFTGALAASLSSGADLHEAATAATVAAGRIVALSRSAR